MRTIRFLLPVMLAAAAAAQTPSQPNFVVILADDLGYGDLGVYGSRQNRTPHLDKLAAEGLRFTDFHSNGPMCTPTRAALITGLYPQRLGRLFESPLSGWTGAKTGLPHRAVTLAEQLRDAGYVSGAFGKWHLGYAPPNLPGWHGFDEFRGLSSGDGDHHTQIDRLGNEDWWLDNRIAMEKGYTGDLVTRDAVSFIERHKDRPFFLYVPHLLIHFPWQGPEDPPQRVKGQNYEDDKWGIIPDRANVAPHVKAMVESLDGSVGQIMAALQRHGLDEKTLVVFTSDNGGYLTYSGGFANISSNGPLRGQKTDTFEGGHRVPAIFRWPGRIRAGVSDALAITFDLVPTLVRLAGAEPVRHDGVDLRALLFEGKPLPERDLFWRIGAKKAARRGDWKLVSVGGAPPMLFDLKVDIGEQRDLAAANPETARALAAALAAWERNVEANIIR